MICLCSFVVQSFVIGREKDPSNSEVARLIKQSLDNDIRIKEERERRMQMQNQTQYNNDETDSESEQPESPGYSAVSINMIQLCNINNHSRRATLQ